MCIRRSHYRHSQVSLQAFAGLFTCVSRSFYRHQQVSLHDMSTSLCFFNLELDGERDGAEDIECDRDRHESDTATSRSTCPQ